MQAVRDDVIYLDNPATTPCDPRVVDAMLPWLGARAANASQQLHEAGRGAAAAVEVALAQVARTVGVDPGAARVVATSGATEANNLALLGTMAGVAPGSRLVVSATEHASVLAPAGELKRRGFDVRVVPVDADGLLRLDELEAALHGGAALVSVQAVNNETGVCQPLDAVGALAKRAGATLHVDAVQAFGRIPLDPLGIGADLVSLSAHKVHGPCGVGALVVSRVGAVALAPMLHGGGQQDGLRPGTCNVAGIVGFGEAARIARVGMDDERRRCHALQERLERGLAQRVSGLVVNGASVPRGPVITSAMLPGVDAAALLASMPRIAASTTSACSSGGRSHVLEAMGRTAAEAAGTIRLGLGRTTTREDVDAAIELVGDAWSAASARSGSSWSRELAFA